MARIDCLAQRCPCLLDPQFLRRHDHGRLGRRPSPSSVTIGRLHFVHIHITIFLMTIAVDSDASRTQTTSRTGADCDFDCFLPPCHFVFLPLGVRARSGWMVDSAHVPNHHFAFMYIDRPGTGREHGLWQGPRNLELTDTNPTSHHHKRS